MDWYKKFVMECIKKLHDKLDQVDKVHPKLVKFVNLVMQIFHPVTRNP